MNTIVTILIPVYNRAQYIEECIRSVQAQSLRELEILVIDDGSTDSTLQLCKNMAEHDPRIRLLAGCHHGVSAARNLGLAQARGKYIFFLDSDDVIHPLILETLVQGMEQYNVPISGTSVRNVPQHYWHKVPDAIAKETAMGTVQYTHFEEAIKRVFKEKTPLSVMGGTMFRRDWIGNTCFKTDLYIGEDFYFIYENLIKGADVLFLKEVWYYCRLHDSNLSWDFNCTGFMNRAYRRELVWKSEEALGRPENANIQKQQLFGIYLQFLKKDKVNKYEKAKMRKALRSYQKALLPALSLRNKLLFLLLVYIPILQSPIVALMKKRDQKSGI